MRILGICFDGQAEGHRIEFDSLPVKGARVTIMELSTGIFGRPLFSDKGDGSGWHQRMNRQFIYEVDTIQEDNHGHVVFMNEKT